MIAQAHSPMVPLEVRHQNPGAKDSKHSITLLISSVQYNAKRRHWRRTKLNI